MGKMKGRPTAAGLDSTICQGSMSQTIVARRREEKTKMEKISLLTEKTGYFFLTVNLLIAVAILMGAISIGVMFYSVLQFLER